MVSINYLNVIKIVWNVLDKITILCYMSLYGGPLFGGLTFSYSPDTGPLFSVPNIGLNRIYPTVEALARRISAHTGVFGGVGVKTWTHKSVKIPSLSSYFIILCVWGSKVHKTILLHEFLNWSFVLREEHVEDVGFAGSHSGTVLWDAIRIVR
jgi:hypothetical protein